MEWRDEGIVIGLRRHGETSAIVEAMTRAHGRHLGLVKGGRSSRMSGTLQPGNTLGLVWRARLDEHLGAYAIEPLTLRAGRYLTERARARGARLSRRAAAAAARARSAREPVRRARRHRRPSRRPHGRARAAGALRGADPRRGRLRARSGDLRLDGRARGPDLRLAEVRPRGERQRRRALARPPSAAAGFPQGAGRRAAARSRGHRGRLPPDRPFPAARPVRPARPRPAGLPPRVSGGGGEGGGLKGGAFNGPSSFRLDENIIAKRSRGCPAGT